VLDGDAIPEGAAKQRGHRWRQCDFRNEQQDLTAGALHRLRESQIDLGLAAAGDTVQQRGPKASRVNERRELFESRALLRRQLTRGIWRTPGHRRALERIAVLGLSVEGHEPSRGEPGQHVPRDPSIA
jgi:hypothetical protein